MYLVGVIIVMMSPRICPKCKKELPSFSHYFCPSCGEKLPGDVARTVIFPKFVNKSLGAGESIKDKVVAKVGSAKKNFNLDKKLIMELSGVLLIIGAIFGVKVFVNNYYSPDMGIFDEFVESTESTISTNADLLNDQVLTSTMSYASASFKTNSLRYYVPSDVDLYIEFHDIGWLVASKPEFFTFLSESNPFLKGPFAVFSMDMGDEQFWGFVGNLTGDLPEEFVLEEPWTFGVSNDVFIVANSEKMTDLISKAHSGIIKNITKSSKFVTSTKSYSGEGQVMVVFLTYGGRKAFEEISQNVTNDMIRDIISRALDLGFNEVVVR